MSTTTPQLLDISKYTTIADFMNYEITINNEVHKFNPNAICFYDMLDYASDLQSGMILKLNQDTNEMTMTMTKEYSLSSKKVKVNLACKLFDVSIDDPSIDLDSWMHMIDIVDASGFTKRLEILNRLSK